MGRKANPLNQRLYRPLSSFAVLNLRRKSLLRGNLLVVLSLLVAVRLSDFPRSRATMLLTIPAVVAMAGTFETVRCMQQRWNFYHGGVVLCVYMDLMAMSLILFLLFSPYML
jgi:hypothetical protein